MIYKFRDKYRFLSNFYPCNVKWHDIVFPSVEHAFQAAKCANPEDYVRFLHVTAGQAKRIGRSVALRSDWESVKLNIMKNLLRSKFSQPELKAKLLATGTEELLEGNHWGDTFWGVDETTLTGENHLGKLLMEIRTELS